MDRCFFTSIVWETLIVFFISTVGHPASINLTGNGVSIHITFLIQFKKSSSHRFYLTPEYIIFKKLPFLIFCNFYFKNLLLVLKTLFDLQ